MKRKQFSWRLPAAALLCAVPMAHAQLDASKLLAYWKLDDSGGSTTAMDSSGNGKDASVIENSTAADTFGMAGQVGTAWQTSTDPTDYPNMLSDYLEGSDSDGALQAVATNSFTLTGWFKVNDLNTSGSTYLFSNSFGGGGIGATVVLHTGVHFGIDPTSNTGTNGHSTLVLRVGGIDSVPFPGAEIRAWEPVSGSGLLSTAHWYFWAARSDRDAGGTLGVWWIREDQVFTAGTRSNGDSSGTSPGDTAPTLGNPDAPGGFDGLIDEVTVWDKALSDADVQSIFEAGASGQPITVVDLTPRFTTVDAEAQTGLEFQSDTGSTYRLEFKNDPGDPEFIRTGYEMVGDGGHLRAFDPDGFNTQKTYQIVIQ
jgi:hypothetical protein